MYLYQIIEIMFIYIKYLQIIFGSLNQCITQEDPIIDPQDNVHQDHLIHHLILT